MELQGRQGTAFSCVTKSSALSQNAACLRGRRGKISKEEHMPNFL